MNENMNLEDTMSKITDSYAHKLAELEDSSIYAYIKGTIELLQYQGKDITQYAAVRIDSPMEMKENNITVRSQYRIVPIEELTNLPTYGEEE